jgi:hypothetical protein
MKLWIGHEKEGRFKNLLTLFVNGDVSKVDIQNAINKYPYTMQIYFGAGKCSDIYWETVQYIIDNFKHNKIIMVEVDVYKVHEIPTHLLNDIYVIVTINNNNFSIVSSLNKLQTQIKIQDLNTNNKYLVMFDLLSGEETNMENFENLKYEDDEVIL